MKKKMLQINTSLEKKCTICNKWQNLHYMQQLAIIALYATIGKTYTICNNWQILHYIYATTVALGPLL